MNFLSKMAQSLLLFFKPTPQRLLLQWALFAVKFEVEKALNTKLGDTVKARGQETLALPSDTSTGLQLSTILDHLDESYWTNMCYEDGDTKMYIEVANTIYDQRALVISFVALPKFIDYHSDFCVVFLPLGDEWYILSSGCIDHDSN